MAERGLGALTIPQLVGLWVIVTVGLLLRVLGLGWGLPPTDPGTAASGSRSSYAIDESTALDGLAQTDPAHLDFAPRVYHWGTLHLSLTLAALETAEAGGAFSRPWRQAYREMRPVDFERVYLVARFVSVIADLTTVFIGFFIGLRLGGPWAALWTAGLYALAPGAITQAAQIRVDVSATMLGALTLLFALSPNRPGRTGLAAGLAVAAKYSVAPLVCAFAVGAWRRDSGGRRWVGVALAAAAAGFLIGEPFVVTDAFSVFKQAATLLAVSGSTPAEITPAPWTLLAETLENLARFGIGLPAALLAGIGGYLLIREKPDDGKLIAAALLVGLAALIPQKWPLLRYSMPLIPGLASLAAFAAVRWRGGVLVGAVALAFAGGASLAQVSYRLAPHPGNLTLRVLQRAAEPGESVSNPLPKIPPLPADRHPPGPNPLLEDLTAAPPVWVVVTDLPVIGYPRQNVQFLRTMYNKVALFRTLRQYAWATAGETDSPHDWKYTHPEMTLFRLRSASKTERR